LKAPFLSKPEIRKLAEQFLNRFHNARTCPIPIEQIVEMMLGMDIIPMPGLQSHFDVVAFISADKKEIRVDETVYLHRQSRYRFSLAHEIGHWFMHSDIWAALTFRTVDDWKQQSQQFPAKEYGILEWQANEFAGLMLVPPEELRDEVERQKVVLETAGHSVDDFDADTLAASMAIPIATVFEVSTQVAQRRITADNLV
jgi:hypothetical protein